MRGHIIKRGSTYSFVVDIGRDPNTGKRRQKWFSGYKLKKDAEKALTAALADIEAGTLVLPDDITLAAYLKRWLSEKEKTLSPTTVAGYTIIIEKHINPSIGSTLLQELRPLAIQNYYRSKLETLSARTVLHHHRLLHKALADAVRWQSIKSNPADGVDPPKARKYSADVLDPSEVEAMLTALEGHRLEVPISLMLFLGLRRGELLGLRWEDIDLDRGLVSIRNNLVRVGKELQLKSPKTEDSSRTLSLTGPMLSLLKLYKGAQDIQKNALGKYYNDQGFVFALEDGSPFHLDTFTHAFADFLKSSGLKKIRLHDLRHTNATLLLSSGVAAKVVSNRLGHSNIGITLDLYSHVLRSMEEVAADTIDGIMFKKNSPK